MAPVHETDVAEKRWKDAEWRFYELWEKVERRNRRKRQGWILATAILFVLLSSAPILMDRWPKWRGLRAARQLSQKLIELKRQAATSGEALRLSFLDVDSLRYVVESSKTCDRSQTRTQVASGSLLGKTGGAFRLLSPDKGSSLGISGMVSSFCYDAIHGNDLSLDDRSVAAFGVIPVKDLAESRLDRVSLVFLKGPSAEITFE